MVSEKQSSSDAETNEYEKFGLYPYKTLQDIVTRLDSGDYKDSHGNALGSSAAFQELEKMAYEPALPDSATLIVAGMIHNLEEAGYKDDAGRDLRNSNLILALKHLNVRKLFRSQAKDGLQLLATLEAISYQISEGSEIKKLEDDPVFHDLRRIITLEGREDRG